MSSGSSYSGKPLVTKLGYKPGDKVAVPEGPDWFVAYLIENNVQLVSQPPAEWVHVFVKHRVELEAFVHNLDWSNISKGLWVSWPKKSSKVPTDLTEQSLRDVILPLGWVDTKVAAVDETWSGLKFHLRKQK